MFLAAGTSLSGGVPVARDRHVRVAGQVHEDSLAATLRDVQQDHRVRALTGVVADVELVLLGLAQPGPAVRPDDQDVQVTGRAAARPGAAGAERVDLVQPVGEVGERGGPEHASERERPGERRGQHDRDLPAGPAGHDAARTPLPLAGACAGRGGLAGGPARARTGSGRGGATAPASARGRAPRIELRGQRASIAPTGPRPVAVVRPGHAGQTSARGNRTGVNARRGSEGHLSATR